METEELIQGQGWDEIQISSVLVQGLSHDWLRLFHPDPFFSILRLVALFHQPSLLFGNTFGEPRPSWAETWEERSDVRRDGSAEPWAPSLWPAVAGAMGLEGIEENPTAGSHEMAHPWESFLWTAVN